MLILSRKNGESIVIDGGIRVTVNAIRGRTVKFGIDAPKETPIHRSEIRRKIREPVPKLPVATNASDSCWKTNVMLRIINQMD